MARQLDGCKKAIMSNRGCQMSGGMRQLGRRHEAAEEAIEVAP